MEKSETDKAIGGYLKEFINDGDYLQIGIGGILNALVDNLMEKKDLGIHSELVTTSIMRLMKAGVVNNERKQINKGKTVTCFAFGTEELYEFLDNNPSILFLDNAYTNDPYIVGQNDNMISINTTVEVDLTGQCCSESIGTKQVSGSGGQADMAVGAQRSKNGKSFICLTSTVITKDPVTGEKIESSKIVPTLKEGVVVTLARADVDYVVTEFGVADLRGTSVKERVHALIGIANPRFREELLYEAKKMLYI